MEPFARTIDAAKKYVVSSTLDRVDWNAELVHGDLGNAVQQLKRESGKGLLVGGAKLPQALAELGLIDEYEFVVRGRDGKEHAAQYPPSAPSVSSVSFGQDLPDLPADAASAVRTRVAARWAASGL